MNNLTFAANPQTNFRHLYPNHANCQAQIQGLPRWINNQPFWTYQCKCCQTYQFKPGQVGGFYD